MNNKQKYTLIIALILIVISVVVWITQGAEVFTKTQILVDKTTDLDRMLGVENKQFENKFVLGLDYTAAFSAVVAVISGFIIYRFRNKRKEIK